MIVLHSKNGKNKLGHVYLYKLQKPDHQIIKKEHVQSWLVD